MSARLLRRQTHDQVLATYATAMRPAMDAMDQAVGDGSFEQTLLIQKRHDLAVSMANLGVARKLTGVLPQPSYNRWSGENIFTARTVGRAKAIQGNTLWWRGNWPSYLIGERRQESPKWLDIMMLDAGVNQNPRIATVKTNAFRATQAEALRVLTTPYSDAEMEALFDEGSGSMLICSHSPGTIPITGEKKSWASVMGGVPDSARLEHGIPGELMEVFGVEDHLNVLATAFDQVAVLDDARARWGREVTRLEARLQ